MKKMLMDSFQMTDEEAEIFHSIFTLKEYKKGEVFLRYGEVSNKIGFLERGLVKCVLRNSTKELIDDFAFENQFIANYHSFLTKLPSKKELVFMKDSVIKVASRNQIEELGQEHKFIESMARKFSEGLFLSTHQKLEDIRLLNAKERYLKLLNSNSNLIQEIPQYEIASYLNITPETVSRIRNELANAS